MNNDSIKQKLDNLYADAKSKNFLNHLIKAYFPLSKVTKVTDRPKEGRLVCVLTNQRLINTNDFSITKESDEFKSSLTVNIQASIEGKLEPKGLTKEVNGKLVALTGEKTTTYASYLAVQALTNWVNEKIKSNDKHITWLVRSMVGDSTKVTFQKKTAAEINGYRKPATTFGDLESLQKLKVLFETEEA